jgi:predicted nucleic acid-binding protein
MIYLDASVLVSLYCPDANSAPASKLMRLPRGAMAISALAELETVNAIGLRIFRKQMSAAQAAISLRSFETDLDSTVFQRHPLPEAAFRRARDLSRVNTPQSGIRTMDLLHVTAALELDADALYSFDLRQRDVARAAGLKLNPLP